jgi:hypothetical protein
MTRSAAARISETADALLDWLHSRQQAVTADPPTPPDAVAVTGAAGGTDPAAAVDLPSAG